MLTTALDLLGVTCLAALAFFVWEPLPLLVVGVGALLTSWRMAKTSSKAPRS